MALNLRQRLFKVYVAQLATDFDTEKLSDEELNDLVATVIAEDGQAVTDDIVNSQITTTKEMV